MRSAINTLSAVIHDQYEILQKYQEKISNPQNEDDTDSTDYYEYEIERIERRIKRLQELRQELEAVMAI